MGRLEENVMTTPTDARHRTSFLGRRVPRVESHVHGVDARTFTMLPYTAPFTVDISEGAAETVALLRLGATTP